MFKKEITYTVSEFLEMQRQKENTDNILQFIVKGVGTTLFLIANPTVAFANSGLDGLDVLGNTFLTIIRRLGYWIALICAIAEIIKMASQGGSKDEILKIVLKYLLIYATLFLIPKLFDLITTTLGFII